MASLKNPNGAKDWLFFSNEADWKYVNDLLSTVNAALLSRVIYQGSKNYWPSAATNPSSSKYDKDFAHWLGGI
jgi:hypothetical protein